MARVPIALLSGNWEMAKAGDWVMGSWRTTRADVVAGGIMTKTCRDVQPQGREGDHLGNKKTDRLAHKRTCSQE
jgi:hypothetical protein